jgi:hypothetical protein
VASPLKPAFVTLDHSSSPQADRPRGPQEPKRYRRVCPKWGIPGRGSKWQNIYPGGTVVADSERAGRWAAALGVDFHEVRLELNAHDLTLVFSDLEITEVAPGYAPFVVGAENHFIAPMPLSPDDPP